MRRGKDQLKTYARLTGFSIFTGASFNLAKYTVGYFSPFAAAAWRFGLAAAVLLIIAAVTEGIRRDRIKRNASWYIALGLVGILGFSTLFFAGLQFTSSVNGALIMALNPLLTTLMARMILKDRIAKPQAAGIGLALIGVIIVVMHGSSGTLASFSIGDVIIFGGNLCWTFYGVCGRRFIQEGSPLSTTAYTMSVGAIGLTAVSLFAHNPVALPSIPIGAWGAIVFMGLFTSVFGYLWWNKGITDIGAGKTSLFFNLVPVVTMLVSFVTGTPVTFIQILGAAFVILGVLAASGAFAGRRGSARLIESQRASENKP
ncbi:DMT family transporter [Paenibacillus glycinis]|uniref:EamA family transporter n=1 Tax=Paenibacillus glycinis TaxID=2697035 RepID=A0ABW9XXD8_9BACL|nr:EamA family transporter [Paenibacillus glycinis]NBD27373.1 EamA family transporter [Paenibacillus glycinis]